MNPRAGSKPAYSLSRGAPSASWVILHAMPLKYDSTAGGQCQQKNPVFRSLRSRVFLRLFAVLCGNFSTPAPSNTHSENRAGLHPAEEKGELTMDDLKYNSSALLIVGMLIGVVCMLLGI